MKKILFLHPPSPFLLNDRAIAPLGILQISACLQLKNWETDVLDLAGDQNYIKTSLDKISSNSYDTIGFSTTTQQTSKIGPLLKQIRENWETHTVVGGPGPTVDPMVYINMGFDKVVRNEGEYAYDAWIPGGERIISMPLIQNLNDLPFPDRSLVDLKSYHFKLMDINKKVYEPTTHVTSTRGCPFNCGFCCGRKLKYYRTYREFSSERVVAEMDYIAEHYGIIVFTDYCDELNIKKERILKFCNLVKDRNYKLRGFVVCKLFNEEIAKAMSDAGFIEICAGVESADNEILKNNKINKTTVEDSTRARNIARDYGIRFKAFTMLGLPGETKETAYKLRDWLLTVKPDDYDLSIFLPMSGTPIYEYPPKNFSFDKLDFTKDVAFYKGVPGEYKSYVETSKLKKEEIVQLRDEIDFEVRETLGMVQVKRAGV